MSNTKHSDLDADYYKDKPLPNESALQYSRFLTYRDLKPNERSAARVAELHKTAARNCEIASAKFAWVERAKAFDQRVSAIELSVRETGLAEYVSKIMEQEDIETMLLAELVQGAMRKAVLEMTADDEKYVDLKELKHLAGTIDTLMKLRRRRAGLPVNYLVETREAPNYDEDVYVIGGTDEIYDETDAT